MAGDTGFEPVHVGIKIRCLTNLANPQSNGVEGEIRTHGGRDLQSLALGHSATSTYLASVHRLELRLTVLETAVLPLYYTEKTGSLYWLRSSVYRLSVDCSPIELTGCWRSQGVTIPTLSA